MAKLCAKCDNAIIAGACVKCGGVTERVRPRIKNQRKKRSKATRGVDPSRPIPDLVRPMDQGGKKSLMNYFGYTTRKGVSEEKRRSCLESLINSRLTPSPKNRSYISSFKEPSSIDRILIIATLIENQNLRQHWIDKNHKLFPSKKRRQDDVEWLRDLAKNWNC